MYLVIAKKLRKIIESYIVIVRTYAIFLLIHNFVNERKLFLGMIATKRLLVINWL